ncbi:MAG: helix-turn-helix domain-containing protein [Candidatus Micrarchaeaceae archaeon]
MGYKLSKRHITLRFINMVAMKTAYKYRAYPSKEQKAKLDRQMFLAKNLYNSFLKNQSVLQRNRKDAYRI